MEGKEKGRKKGRKESSFPSPEWCPSSLQGKERNPLKPSVSKGKGEGRKGKKEERDGFRIRFLRGIQGKKDGRKEGKRKEECSFSVFQGGFSLSRRKKKSSGIKRRRRERRKRKKRKCLAWRMGYLGTGKRNGRKEEKKEEDLARCVSHKVLCLLFYSVFCCPVRINYNLPAGYGASAVT